ncbi:lytic murein transglycosylase B [Legionella waltersii]|uniref:Membrane bound lytic murein transglycosylase n=1 Tax=Legionella waltersii TaxID=66969 RepID=A0A0W1A1M6_9GAMM|nr:lytic murein transglycosylase B [Legionella waltersii]KTD75276.1 membrane bound lytic murein transglycosylase [Legionella waltersii]SNV06868.1 membrane bound lytic murein transglycosylase [Legionella waltersii]
MRKTIWLGFITLFLFSFDALSNSGLTQRKDVQAFINSMVKNHQFNRNQLINTLEQVQLQPQIIESMERPFEKKTWDVYSTLFLTAQRIEGGLKFWSDNEAALEKAQKRFGVPPEIIVAILGVETLYGERQGDYNVLDALATLAFNYPKRSAFFTKELKEYLLLCREQGVSPVQYKGSYAGAIGMPQFMPSSYRYYAVDFSNKGARDLVNNSHDAIGSIANYFHKHGWKTNQGVAQFAKVSGRKYKSLRTNPRTANYAMSQLSAAGIKPVTASSYNPPRAGLIELVTNKGNEYWLAYPNFFVITRYNSSPQYAMVVYLLSQQLKQHRRDYIEKKHRAYA